MPTLDADGAKKTSLRIIVNPTRKSTKTPGSATYKPSTKNNIKSMATALARLKTHKPNTHAQTKHSPPKLVVINEGIVPSNELAPQRRTRKNKNESPGILGSALSSIGSLFSRRPPRDPSAKTHKQLLEELNANRKKWAGVTFNGRKFAKFSLKQNIGEIKGKLEALEEAIHAPTATKRNQKRLAEARNNLANNLSIATKAANKLGINASTIEATPLEEPFSLIKHTNGPLEHYALFGSTRKEQTGLTKSITNYTMNRSNNVRNTVKAGVTKVTSSFDAVKAGVTKVTSSFDAMKQLFSSSIQSILVTVLVLLAVLASIMSGNIYAMGSVIGLAVLYFFVYPTIKKQLFGLLRIGYSH
jgi:hypothetical protein